MPFDPAWGPPLNDKPWEYRCRYGTVFECDRCDFAAPIRVTIRTGTTMAQLCSDMSEHIGYHATNIWPDRLNGFNGYDTLTMVFFNGDGEEIDLEKVKLGEHGMSLIY